MKILVFNCGSSSIKYKMLDMSSNEHVIAHGLFDRIGQDNAELTHWSEKTQKIKFLSPAKDHQVGIKTILDLLVDADKGVLESLSELYAVGHRVVHGGETFSGSVVITDEVIKKMEECSSLAPLHNPANLKGIYAIKELLPNIVQCGTFDTAFHQTMPEYSFMYALPSEYYTKHKVRRYGFHGASHKFVSESAAQFLGKDIKDMKIITCHLGNGASICAVKNGKSMDTSMGLTPVEGLIMGTRAGDLDLGALLHLMELENLDVAGARKMINSQSGILGISGVSSDMRDIEDQAWNQKNPKAILALDMYHYRIRKYIGAYAAAMGGVDAIVFTGGVGENGPESREEICKPLEFLGFTFDVENNKGKRGKLMEISTPDSRVKVLTVPTNEELVIARDTFTLVSNN